MEESPPDSFLRCQQGMTGPNPDFQLAPPPTLFVLSVQEAYMPLLFLWRREIDKNSTLSTIEERSHSFPRPPFFSKPSVLNNFLHGGN